MTGSAANFTPCVSSWKRLALLSCAISVLALFFAPHARAQVATYTFADGGLDEWIPFGSPVLGNVMPPVSDPAGDTHALLVTNRTSEGFMGPSLESGEGCQPE